MFVVEVTRAYGTGGGGGAPSVETLYFSDEAYTTTGSDTPAHTAFETRLLDPGSIGRHVFSDGKTGGYTRLEMGSVRLDNTDGRFDEWLGWDVSLDGRALVIRSGNAGDAYPSAFTVLFTGTVENAEITLRAVTLNIRDKAYLLNKPVCINVYAGDNVLPDGLEGTSQDLGNKRKPRLYGTVQNISPYLVNTSLLIYQVSDGPVDDISAVYDRGASLDRGQDYSSESDMLNNEPDPGFYRAYLAGGYFRLGATPDGQVTAYGDYRSGVYAAQLEIIAWDSVTVTDWAQAILSFNRAISVCDAPAVTESVEVRRLGYGNIFVTENVTVTESVSVIAKTHVRIGLDSGVYDSVAASDAAGGAIEVPAIYHTLLLHFDGTHGDSSVYGQSTADYGNCDFSSTEPYFKFTTSGYFPGGTVHDSPSYVLVDHSDDHFNFGSQDWTIDWWSMAYTYYDSARILVSKQDIDGGHTGPLLIGKWYGYWYLYLSSNGTSWNVAEAFQLAPCHTYLPSSTSNWSHTRVCRYGDKIYCFEDGVHFATKTLTSSSVSLADNNAPLAIGGYYQDGQGALPCWNGWLDEFTLLMGRAKNRSTASFTPPDVPFTQ